MHDIRERRPGKEGIIEFANLLKGRRRKFIEKKEAKSAIPGCIFVEARRIQKKEQNKCIVLCLACGTRSRKTEKNLIKIFAP